VSFIVCIELALTSCIPCLVGVSSHGVAMLMRVRATMIISNLVIQFSSSSIQSTLPNRASDNLVSRDLGSASVVMSP
jgi:hypothetical protein